MLADELHLLLEGARVSAQSVGADGLGCAARAHGRSGHCFACAPIAIRSALYDQFAGAAEPCQATSSTRRAVRGEQGRLSVGYTSAVACHPLVPRHSRVQKSICHWCPWHWPEAPRTILWWQGSDGEAGAKCDFAHFRPSKAGCMIMQASCSPLFPLSRCPHTGWRLFLWCGGQRPRRERHREAENVQECVQETALRIVSRLLRPRIVSREGAMFWSGPGIMASGHVNRI